MSQICHDLHHLFNSLPVFGWPFDAQKIPHNGIYVLFEVAEVAHGANRIVRIGTHTGDGKLRSRLEEHFVRENKDRSIFRRNIGRAILRRDHDPFLAQWDLDLTTRASRQKHAASVDFVRQRRVEQLVTAYMQSHFRFVVFRVDDKDRRLDWESKMISTVSLCDECGPSPSWLGQFSPTERIRLSGLWLTNELYKQPLSESEYRALEGAIRRMWG